MSSFTACLWKCLQNYVSSNLYSTELMLIIHFARQALLWQTRCCSMFKDQSPIFTATDLTDWAWLGASVLSVCTKFALPGLWLGVPNQILYNILLSRKGYFWFIHWQIEVVLLHQIFDWEPNWLYQILVQRTLIETRLCLVQTFVADCFLVTYSSI